MKIKKKLISKNYFFKVWDTAGQERFKSMTPMYYRNANVAFLVFDLTDYATFASIKTWVTELRRNVDYAMLLVLIGNKSDLPREQHFHTEEVEDYAKSISASYYETSALLDSNINQLFMMTAKKLVILESNDCHQINNLRSNPLLDSDFHNQEGISVPSSEEGPLQASIAHGTKARSYCC